MTGGGRGRCYSAAAENVMHPYAGYRRGMGFGRGFRGGCGRRMGFGAGYGRRFGYDPATAGTPTLLEPAKEIDMLKAQANDMQAALQAINDRIQALGKDLAEES